MFAYYVDGIKFRNYVPLFGKVIEADLKCYESLGIKQVNPHFGSTREVHAVELLSIIIYAKLMFNDSPAELLVDEYCRAVFAADATVMSDFLRSLEDTLAISLRRCGYDAFDNGCYQWPTASACGFSWDNQRFVEEALSGPEKTP